MGGNVEVVLEESHVYPERETVKKVKVMKVPQSDKFPDGIKYRIHYGTLDGETIIRYDNLHGVHE